MFGTIANPTVTVLIAQGGQPAFGPCTPNAFTTCFADQFSTTFKMALLPGQPEPVTLMAGVLAVDGSSIALADPMFSIDPAFPLAAQYALSFSDGILNISPSPEPSTLVLLGSSFFGLWRAVVRRSRGRAPLCRRRAKS
jgi:hypothetical protein